MGSLRNIEDLREGIVRLDREREDREALEKALKPYQLDGMPYERERIIREAKVHATQWLVAGYHLGKCLILLKEREGHANFASLLIEHFSGIPKRTIQHVMRFAQFAASWPKFRAVFDKPGMMNKGLALLSGLSEPEVEEELRTLEETGQIAGLDEIELQGKTLAELKREVKRLRALRDKKYEGLEAENDRLRAQNEALAAQRLVPGMEKAQKLLAAGEKQMNEALKSFAQADFGLLAGDAGSVALCRMLVDKGRRVLDELEKQMFPYGVEQARRAED